MSMTFTKLFSSITESTIWREPDQTRLVWITMLAMADKYGRVWASIPGLADRARVPVDSCRSALHILLSPDPDSRTKDAEGRRIVEIDGGWQLINYSKYRALRDSDERRMYKAEKQREYRAKAKSAVDESVDKSGQSGTLLNSVDTGGHNAEAEADKISRSTLEEIYEAYPRHVGKVAALKAIESALRKNGIQPPEMLERVKAYAKARAKEDPQFTPHPATWFNQGRYYDDNLKPQEKLIWEAASGD